MQFILKLCEEINKNTVDFMQERLLLFIFKLCFAVRTVGGWKADQLIAVVSAQDMTAEEGLTFS